jgi:long-chain fatty acid transport protein
MERRAKAAVALAILGWMATTPGAARATDGYFSLGYGTKTKGMAGSGIALPQDAMCGVTNPAGMVRIGSRYDLGAAFFSPDRQYTVNGAPSGYPGTFGLAPGTVESGNTSFGVPHLAYNRMLGERRSFGVTISGNGGMNTTYPADAGGFGTFGGGQAGVNLEQLFVSPTYAVQTDKKTSVGVAAILAYQEFDAQGLRNFGGFTATGSSANLTDNGEDISFGVGARLGVLHDMNPKLTVGAAYQTQVVMQRFKKYSDLFAGQGGFDIPATFTAGLAYKASKTSVVTLDVQHVWYSAVHSVGDPFSNLFYGMGTGDPNYLLGGDAGPGFGWKDMTTTKLGYQWEAGSEWTLRTGIAHGAQPIRSSEVLFNILAPGVQEWHFTGGFTKKMGKHGEVSLAAMYSPREHVVGPNPLEAPGQQTIGLSMRQVEFEVSWGKRF